MKNGNISAVYGFVAMLSVLLWIGYLLFDKKKARLFSALFGCVAIANSGYFLLSVCSSLAAAELANGISYFGTAFSMLVMLRIICDVCGVRVPKWAGVTLAVISTAAFALAASSDWMGLYYRAVSLETVNGTTRLVNESGPLHCRDALYLGLDMARLVGIIAPLPPSVYERMMAAGRYGYVTQMGELLPRLFAEYGFACYDKGYLPDTTAVQYIDGFHGGDEVYAGILLQLAKEDETMARLVDTDTIIAQLQTPHENPRVLPEAAK